MSRIVKLCAMLIASILITTSVVAAQPPTATPASLELPTNAPFIEEIVNATATWTPTPEGQIMVEAIDFVNVRAEPDTNAAALDQIRAGTLYPALARDFEWIQIQLDATRRGWVFRQLVNVVGDFNSLPDMVSAPIPTAVPAELNATTTQAALTMTPGGLLTATAAARANPGSSSTGATVDGPAQQLPTFTYPPGLVAGAPDITNAVIEPTEEPVQISIAESGDLPPIAPVLILGAIGFLGLVFSSLKR